jgi:hypothetical protein
MPMNGYKPEQIVTLLRQIEVEIANGKTTQACKEAEGRHRAPHSKRKATIGSTRVARRAGM